MFNPCSSGHCFSTVFAASMRSSKDGTRDPAGLTPSAIVVISISVFGGGGGGSSVLICYLCGSCCSGRNAGRIQSNFGMALDFDVGRAPRGRPSEFVEIPSGLLLPFTCGIEPRAIIAWTSSYSSRASPSSGTSAFGIFASEPRQVVSGRSFCCSWRYASRCVAHGR